MNGRQAAKAAAKKIEELMLVNIKMTQDIKDYNDVILGMIEGGDPCQWCEDLSECQLEAKEAGKGCAEWMLRFRKAGDPGAGEDGTADAAEDPLHSVAEQ